MVAGSMSSAVWEHGAVTKLGNTTSKRGALGLALPPATPASPALCPALPFATLLFQALLSNALDTSTDAELWHTAHWQRI